MGLIALCALVGGCGGSGGRNGAKKPGGTHPRAARPRPLGGPGTYTYRDPSGAVFTLTIPAPAGNQLEREIEAHRRKLGDTARHTYAALTINNTSGSQPIDLDATGDVLSVVNDQGQQVPFQFGDRQIGTCVSDPSKANCNQTVYNEEVDLDNKLLDTKKAVPGAVTNTIIVSTAKDVAIRRIFLLQSPSAPSTAVEMTKRGAG